MRDNRAKNSSKKFKLNIFAVLLMFVFAALATIGVIQLISHGGEIGTLEYTPTFAYDTSVSAAEKANVEAALKDFKTTSPTEIKVSAEDLKYELPENYIKSTAISNLSKLNKSLQYQTLKEGLVYSDILVPTTDFYSGLTAVTKDDAAKLEFVSINSLTPDKRVVSIDGNYFLDTMKSGAEFRILKFDSGNADTDLQAVTKYYNQVETSLSLLKMTAETLSFAQTGVTALSRNMTNTLNGKAGGNGAYFAEKIKDFLAAKDLTHISNESSFVDGCKGGTNTMLLCTDWRAMDSFKAIGVDIVELTGNHNNNYGADTNVDSIKKYHESSMTTVGGGVDAVTARIPIRIYDDTTASNASSSDSNNTSGDASGSENSNAENSSAESSDIQKLYSGIKNEKGANITFLAYNESTSSVANGELAHGNHAGANGWDEANAKKEIAAAKERGDFILVDIQFAECYCYPDGFVEFPQCDSPIAGQQSFFRHLIDMGADMAVGTQAHQPQTFEIYKGKPIYYGLGNLFFDQTYWPDTEKGLILTHYFVAGKYVQTRISPTVYGTEHQVRLMDESVATNYLNRLIKSSDKGE